MKLALSTNQKTQKFVEEVIKISGQNIWSCYQCGKCAAGCPVCQEMDYAPNQIIRFLQLGLWESVLSTNTIWLCAGCHTCSIRCPQMIELAKVMEAVRIIAQREQALFDITSNKLIENFGTRLKEGIAHIFQMDIKSNFHCLSDIFLQNVRYYGRIFETGLIFNYNINSGYFFAKFLKAPIMMIRSKIGFIPREIEGLDKVEKIFKKVDELEELEEKKE